MKKVALHGSYYGDNFGDTLFVIHFINWIQTQYASKEMNIYLPFAGERVRDLVNVSKEQGVKSLIKSDKIVFIGGGYLGEPTVPNNIWPYRLIIRHLLIAFISWVLQKPYIFIGVGAGPITNKLARNLTVFLCNRSEKVVVRDYESKKYLEEYGVAENKILVTADSILTLDENDVDEISTEKIEKKLNKRKNTVYIGVHLPVGNEYTSQLRTILSDLKNYTKNLPDYQIVVFNDFYKPSYEYIAKDMVYKEFDKNKVTTIDYTTPDNLIALINQLDIVMTTKLHCGIVSNCLGVYTISISVHNKTIRLYRQLGLEERNISLFNYKSNNLDSLLSQYKVNKEKYSNVPIHVRKAAETNKEILLDFLAK